LRPGVTNDIAATANSDTDNAPLSNYGGDHWLAKMSLLPLDHTMMAQKGGHAIFPRATPC